jgi:transglutaminase-like putative cysteine protease
MLIQIKVAMQYRFMQPNTVLLALEAAHYDGQQIVNAHININDTEVSRFAGDADVGQRIIARARSHDMNLTYSAQVDVTRSSRPLHLLQAAPLHLVPGAVIPYLRASRYCQSDKFTHFVDSRFGALAGGQKIAAIRDWIEGELTYVPGSSDADTSVLETFAGRVGVCRDYAHLMCTMARAAQIPARMVAAYSPDITPPDFHALAEVWLEGAWHLVDATGMCSPESTAVIAVGRDAYDIAFMESQVPAEMLYQSVSVVRG